MLRTTWQAIEKRDTIKQQCRIRWPAAGHGGGIFACGQGTPRGERHFSQNAARAIRTKLIHAVRNTTEYIANIWHKCYNEAKAQKREVGIPWRRRQAQRVRRCGKIAIAKSRSKKE
jgi:hypothetical protein